MSPIQEPREVELPRGVIAEASAPLPVIQFPDGSTEPAPASSVKAEDIIGLITSEQIEELEAAKIGGKLTAEQIENVHAASIIGEIINSQIKGLGVGKLEGQITAAQIAAGSIIAEKLAVGAVITEKIAAGAITTGKLAAEAITAEKISASAITTSKIAAGAITAEKITVIELSGITPHLGTITAGKIIGVEIEDSSKLLMREATEEAFPEESAITWSGNEAIAGWRREAENKHVLLLRAWHEQGAASETKGEILLQAYGKKLGIVGTNQAQGKLSIATTELKMFIQGAGAGAGATYTIINSEKESHFLTYGPPGQSLQKLLFHWGRVSSTGVKEAGTEGWTVTKTAGNLYEIKFVVPFTHTPAAMGADNQGTLRTFNCAFASLSQLNVTMHFGSNTTAEEIAFGFIVIG